LFTAFFDKMLLKLFNYSPDHIEGDNGKRH